MAGTTRASLQMSGSLYFRLFRRTVEMRQEGPWLRQVGLEAESLFEFRVGFGLALMGGQDHADVRMGCRWTDDF